MVSKNLEFDYCLAHTTFQSELLEQLDRETNLKTLSPQMLSGSLQGTFLKMVSQMIKPKRVLEIGTFTGYATLCLAEGLQADGVVHTIEANDELAWLINKYIGFAGLEKKVVLHLGDAANIIPTLPTGFDLVFLDAGKLDYLKHYEMVLPKVHAGGFILADNVLWDGKVASNDQKDETAVYLRQFNQYIQEDERVENLLLPLRDGLMLIRKK
jgi:predicted O-methyltransferase YrrM